MILASLLFTALSSISPALALTPEALLARVSASPAELPRDGVGQYGNPFSEVKLGQQYRQTEREDDPTTHGYQAYLSLTPKGIDENREYRKFAQALQQQADVGSAMARSAQMRQAYLTLIDAAKFKEQAVLAQNWSQLLETFRKLYAIESRRSDLSVKDLLKLNNEVENTRENLVEIEAAHVELRQRLLVYDLNIDELDTSDVLSASEIERRMTQLKPAPVSLSMDELKAKLEAEQSGIRFQEARRNHFLDEVKFTFGQVREQKSGRVDLVFNLPFLAARNLLDEQKRIELNIAQARLNREMQTGSARVSGLTALLKGKLNIFRELEASETQIGAKTRFGQNPEIGMEIRRLIEQRKLRKSNLLAEIRTLYVELLFETKGLTDTSGVNFLSKSGRRI